MMICSFTYIFRAFSAVSVSVSGLQPMQLPVVTQPCDGEGDVPATCAPPDATSYCLALLHHHLEVEMIARDLKCSPLAFLTACYSMRR
jgi:hypothetical protein